MHELIESLICNRSWTSVDIIESNIEVRLLAWHYIILLWKLDFYHVIFLREGKGLVSWDETQSSDITMPFI